MLGDYKLVTDGTSKNTYLVNPDGHQIWGIKDLQISMTSNSYFSTQVVIKRYVPYMWADFTSSTSPISFTTLKDDSGNPVIIEERFVNVEILHPSMMSKPSNGS